jgi:acyl carrier protein
MQPTQDTNRQIREAIHEVGNLAVDVDVLQDTDDLYDAGLTSLNTVNLMLAIEDCFDCEFPEEMLSRETFQSISTIGSALGQLLRKR